MCLLCLCYFVWPPLLQVQGLSFQPSLFSPISQHSEYIPSNSHTLCMACRSKIVISHIQTNFSCLTDNSDCNCLIQFFRLKEHLRTSLVMHEIGWKSFGNCWLCFEVIENFYTPSVIFGSRQEIFSNLRKLSEIFGNLQSVVGNCQKFC